jgi:hypothetical protein
MASSNSYLASIIAANKLVSAVSPKIFFEKKLFNEVATDMNL